VSGQSLRVAAVVDLLVLALCAASMRAAFRELFVDIPGVHVARWPGPWSTPKIAATIVLITAIIGLVAALTMLVALRDRGAGRTVRVVEFVAFVAMVCAWLVWTADFLGSAGRFG
jgi:hypothetical protein